MAIDSISLLAQNTYSQIQNRPKVVIDQDIQVQQAVSFQNMVKKDFNSFSKMSPAQILQHIQGAKAATNSNYVAGAYASAGVIGSSVSNLRSTLNQHEKVVRKSLINEASLVDVLTATTEATNTMKTIVSVRDKFMEAFDKVMNMSM
jgi:flagellar hook-basal body complex protein FliE